MQRPAVWALVFVGWAAFFPPWRGGSQAVGAERPAACRAACCGHREFWVVNARDAPCDGAPQRGVDRLTYWKRQPCGGWRRYRLEQFLAEADASLPTTFYVHGNSLDNRYAVHAGDMVYDDLGRGVPAFRLVLWSWPAEHLWRLNPVDDYSKKAQRSEVQGYYLAWLVDKLDPEVRLTLAGHSIGARTVTAALQGLATGRAAGYDLGERRFVGRRPMQAVLVAAAMDHSLLWPGHAHGRALTQVDRMLITTNDADRGLRWFRWLETERHEPLGLTGIPHKRLLGGERSKVVELSVTEWIGQSHRWSEHTETPEIASRLRPYFFYGPEAEQAARLTRSSRRATPGR